MWLSLVFHSLAARCKVRLCAPARESNACTSPECSRIDALTMANFWVVQRWVMLVSYMTLAPAPAA